MIIPYQTTAIERESFEAFIGPPTEYTIISLDVSGPIRKGELWDISGTVVLETALAANVFIRSEIWITAAPGDVQTGVRPTLTRQSGPGDIGNLTPEEVSATILREGTYVWPANAFGPRYIKYFCAAGATQITVGDRISVVSGLLSLKRIIPRR